MNDPLPPSTQNPSGDDDFAAALVGHLEGTLEPAERERLQRVLAEDPQRRNEFVAMCLHARLIGSRLGSDIAVGAETPTAEPEAGADRRVPEGSGVPLLGSLDDSSIPRPGFFSQCTPPSLLAAAMAMGALLTILAIWPAPVFHGWARNEQEVVSEPVSPFVARLVRAVDCQWTAGSAVPTIGGLLREGQRLQIDNGTVEVRFFPGTTVLLEGPARFQLQSESAGKLELGRLLARVPESAKTFCLETPEATVIDLGTEFGAWAKDDGRVEVHVFQGAVEAVLGPDGRPAEASGRLRLSGGEGMRFEHGSSTQLTVDRGRFPRSDRIQEKVRHRQQQAFANALGHDRDVLVHFPIQRPFPGATELHGYAPDRDPLVGKIEGTAWTEGRWPEKDALHFQAKDDRVLVDLPDELEAFTLTAWVRLEANKVHALLHSDGHVWDRPGACHWIISPAGQPLLACVNAENKHVHAIAPREAVKLQLHQWYHLAAVYDGHLGQITHYVDGHEVSRFEVRDPRPLSFGSAQIGNSNLDDFRDGRGLKGCLDELTVFCRVLAPPEILGLYEAGKPAVSSSDSSKTDKDPSAHRKDPKLETRDPKQVQR